MKFCFQQQVHIGDGYFTKVIGQFYLDPYYLGKNPHPAKYILQPLWQSLNSFSLSLCILREKTLTCQIYIAATFLNPFFSFYIFLLTNSDMHMGGVPGYDYATSPRSLHLNQPPYMYSSTTATSGTYGYSIWIAYTPCGRFWNKSFTVGVWYLNR